MTAAPDASRQSQAYSEDNRIHRIRCKPVKSVLKKEKSLYKIKTFADVLEKATEIFGGKDKAYQWYLTPNPLYDGLSPYDVCRNGSILKVFRDLTKTLI